ncbi:MAG: EcsC family protein [Anaerolineae bacterium]|nr:EcsC family protein [Anaerolineae bacterium]
MMDQNLSQTLLIAFGLLCVLPLITLAVLAVIVIRMGQQRLDSWLSPDVARLEQQYEALRARSPEAASEQLITRIVQQQAFKCGIVGAVTGIGGLITLPLALPVDLVLSFRIQAALVNFIAHRYGDDSFEGVGATVRNTLIMTGSSRVTQTSTRFLMRLAVRLIEKSFSKLIPVAGAIIGFGVNYAIVQAMGRAALRWYASQQAAKT